MYAHAIYIMHMSTHVHMSYINPLFFVTLASAWSENFVLLNSKMLHKALLGNNSFQGTRSNLKPSESEEIHQR